MDISWIRALSGKSYGCVTSVPVQRKTEWIFLRLEQLALGRAVDVPLTGALSRKSNGCSLSGIISEED
jgi:hypothetical protein